MPQQIYGFGSFQLNVSERQLTCHASVIRLHAKVFDTLAVLIANAGRLLRKETLMRAIWPNHVVEENNLQHNICVLRLMLGRHDRQCFIETIPGHGYRFAAEVRILEPGAPRAVAELPEPSVLQMQRLVSRVAARLRSAPRWPAIRLSEADQLAVLSRQFGELHRSFLELSSELAQVERRLQQREPRQAG